VYNVHNLIHLPDDVINHDCGLHSISAFPFENYLHQIKKLVKSPINPVSQIVKNLTKVKNCTAQKTFTISASTLTIRADNKNNFVLLKNGNLCCIEQCNKDGTFTSHIINKFQLCSWFEKPCNSTDMNIVCVRKKTFFQTMQKESTIISNMDVIAKLFHMEHHRYHIFFPILQS
jgi:hypothetical protein